ncbi:MAG: hypothetical protein ABL962_08810 [Fimbriimonadaceae bacterium]
MAYAHLFKEKSWNFYWDASSGKMYAEKENMFMNDKHFFEERTKTNVAAIGIAKAWLASRR